MRPARDDPRRSLGQCSAGSYAAEHAPGYGRAMRRCGQARADRETARGFYRKGRATRAGLQEREARRRDPAPLPACGGEDARAAAEARQARVGIDRNPELAAAELLRSAGTR